MWNLLGEVSDLTDDDLRERVLEIEASDEQAAESPVRCAQCGRPKRGDRAACLYCGTRFDGGIEDPLEGFC